MDFEINHGDTEIFDLTVRADGVAVNLTGKSLRFSVKREYTDAAALILKTTENGITVTNAAAGQARVTLNPADTELLYNHEHAVVYDVQLVDGTAVYTVLRGQLIVRPTVG